MRRLFWRDLDRIRPWCQDRPTILNLSGRERAGRLGRRDAQRADGSRVRHCAVEAILKRPLAIHQPGRAFVTTGSGSAKVPHLCRVHRGRRGARTVQARVRIGGSGRFLGRRAAVRAARITRARRTASVPCPCLR